MKKRRYRVSTPVIFIANDQPDDQYLYRQAVAEACPTAVIYFFRTRAELLTAIQDNVYPRPSLLIMDWDMSLRKGYATLAALAQMPARQTLPVVIMTTDDRSVDEEKCQQIGYELVLPKETQYEKLVKQLSGFVQAFV